METITIDTYSFEELSPEVQKKVLENESAKYEIDCDFITEWFTDVLLEQHGIDEVQVNWSLSCCQGDGVAFYGKPSLDKMAEKDEEIKLVLDQIRDIDPDCSLYLTITSNSNHYCHWNTMDIEIEDDIDLNLSDTEVGTIEHLILFLKAKIDKKVKNISKELEKLGYEDIENQHSDESIQDFIEANEFRFTKDGKRNVYL
jgi:hypothetical protein